MFSVTGKPLFRLRRQTPPAAVASRRRSGDIGGVVVAYPRVGLALVELWGEHDLTGRAALAALLDEVMKRNYSVVVDLSETEFIDFSVLDNLVRADNKARLSGNQFALQLGTAHPVRVALETSGLLNYFRCVDTPEKARLSLVDALRPSASGTTRH